MARKHGWKPDPEAEQEYLDQCASAVIARLERWQRKETPIEKAALDLWERKIPSKA